MENNTQIADFLFIKIKKEKWRKRGKWNSIVLSHEIFQEGESTTMSRKLGYPFKRSMGIWLDSGEYFDIQKEWDGLGRVIKDEYRKNKNFLFNYAAHCLEVGNKLICLSKKIGKLDLQKLSNADLGKKFMQLIQECKLFVPFMFSMHSIDEFLTNKFELFLKEFINKNKLKTQDFYDYQIALTYPTRKIFALQERINLLRIAVFSERDGIDSLEVKNKIKAHTKEFGWLNVVNLEDYPFDEKYFLKKLKKIKKSDFKREYEMMKKAEKEMEKKRKKAMKEVSSFRELNDIAKIIQTFGFLRSFRVDVVYVAFFNSWNLFREIATRLNIDILDIKHFSSGEINQALINNLDYNKLLEKRKKGVSCIIIGDTRYELTSDKIKDIKEFLLKSFDPRKIVSEIKGSVAFPGKIQGTCRIVGKLEEMKKVGKGDILVISMTDPNYLPAMERAGAFVTDQGGILCHAAIVSREMKKPCVIGTKIATQVLKDGDLVEVDANRGIVRRIKKGKR